MIVARGVRGPASYTQPGFNVLLGDVQKIRVSSGRMAGVFCASTSMSRAYIINTSSNVVTVQVLDGSGVQVTTGTDLSGQHFFVIADGY